MVDTAQFLTSANITLNFNEVYGHVDYVSSETHLQEVEHPILNWPLQEVFDQPLSAITKELPHEHAFESQPNKSAVIEDHTICSVAQYQLTEERR